MSSLYNRGQQATFYAQFLQASGEAAVSTNDPKISIWHYDDVSGNLVYDINKADMLHAENNFYYYPWVIPVSATYGSYQVKYYGEDQAGLDLESSDIFIVSDIADNLTLYENMLAVNIAGKNLSLLTWSTENNMIINDVEECKIDLFSADGVLLHSLQNNAPSGEYTFKLNILNFNYSVGYNYLCKIAIKSTLKGWITTNKSFSVIQ